MSSDRQAIESFRRPQSDGTLHGGPPLIFLRISAHSWRISNTTDGAAEGRALSELPTYIEIALPDVTTRRDYRSQHQVLFLQSHILGVQDCPRGGEPV